MINQSIQLYPNKPGVTLTTYVLEDSPELLAGKTRPAVVICPGGAYLNCSDREAEPVALRFASMGYHAFVLRYSTHSGNESAFDIPAGDLPVNPDSVYPAPLRDIGKAFLLIREKAPEWLVDIDRIAICGFSAGAHNCAMYAVYWQDPVMSEHFGEKPEAFRPAAAILGYGIGDYNLMFGDSDDPMAKVLADASSIAYMGTKTPDQALLDQVSPALHVTQSAPPMFIWATGGDSLVPVENSTRMANACAAAGVPFEAHIFEVGPHGLSLSDQSTSASKMENIQDVAVWIPLVERWLLKRLALPLLDKPFWMEMAERQQACDQD